MQKCDRATNKVELREKLGDRTDTITGGLSSKVNKINKNKN